MHQVYVRCTWYAMQQPVRDELYVKRPKSKCVRPLFVHPLSSSPLVNNPLPPLLLASFLSPSCAAQVRVRNLTYMQPFSPVLVVAHTRVSALPYLPSSPHRLTWYLVYSIDLNRRNSTCCVARGWLAVFRNPANNYYFFFIQQRCSYMAPVSVSRISHKIPEPVWYRCAAWHKQGGLETGYTRTVSYSRCSCSLD